MSRHAVNSNDDRPASDRRALRWAVALATAATTAALVTGCGIRPTAVPVDAGAPASRTACPSPLHPPAVQPTPTPSALHSTAYPTPAPPSAVASAVPSPTATASPLPPTGSLFSALPSTAAGASAAAHCE